MRSILSISILLACVQASFAQPPETLWTRTYGGIEAERCWSVRQTSDGGYIVAGFTESFGAGDKDFYLVKTNSQSEPLWTRTYGGGYWDNAYSVQQTADGGYIVAGYTNSFGAGSWDFYLVKTNSLGDPLWTRTYGGSHFDEASSVQQTADGGYIVAGVTYSFGAGTPGYTNMYLVKTDSLGDTLWTRTYGGSHYDWANSVQQTADGGYIVAGYTWSFCADSGDFYLVKTNSLGDTLWTRTYGGSGGDYAYSVQQTADGGYIVAGTTESFGAGGWDFYLVKTNSLGDALWTRTYGGSSHDEASSVQQTADGGYIVAGFTYSFGAGGWDFYLVKTNSLGDTLWTRTYGGSDLDMAYSVQQTADGGYIVAGGTWSFGAGVSDFYLIKTWPEPGPLGYVTLISPGPPDWGYRLYRVSGALSRLVFTNFCSGTIGSVSGAAAAAGWTATNYADSIVFSSDTWLSTGSIETFWLSHPYCSDYVTWTAGDSSGTIEGPLPVELTTFEGIAGDEQVVLRWRTESELDNNYFVLYKRKAGEEIFRKLTEIPGHGTTTEPHDYQYVDRFVQNSITYEYRISDVDMTGRETIHEQIVSATPSAAVIPTEFALHAPYPNPFNPVTMIRYDVKETGLVSLKVFDLLGREVAMLVHGTIPAGSYSINWDAGALPSGVYLCRMEARDFTQTRKVVLLK
jgi:uncharacterized delta-60 repeat protein